jgi:hypothetical protein
MADCCESFTAQPLCGRLFSRELSLALTENVDDFRHGNACEVHYSFSRLLGQRTVHTCIVTSRGGVQQVPYTWPRRTRCVLPNLPVPEGTGTLVHRVLV